MKRILYLFIAVSTLLFAASCSNDEPTGGVKDQAGKVFLENGKMVNANTEFMSPRLSAALSQQKWVLDYAFYYDKNRVSDKMDIFGLPISIYPNKIIEYNLGSEYLNFQDYTVEEKKIKSYKGKTDPQQSSIIFPIYYTVVAVDADRIIMDTPKKYENSNFHPESTYARMVWVPAK